MTKEPNEVISVRLSSAKAIAFRALALAEGREPAEQIEFMIMEALIAVGALPAQEIVLHRLRESLLRRFIEKAVEIYTETPRTDITAETARQLMDDPEWKLDYERYTLTFDVRTIHPSFGRRVKLRLGLQTGKAYRVEQPCIFKFSSHLIAADDTQDVA